MKPLLLSVISHHAHIVKQTRSILRKEILLTLSLFFSILMSIDAYSSSDTAVVPVHRQYFHEKVNNEQTACDLLDGIADGRYQPTQFAALNDHITYALITQINQLQNDIEERTSLVSNNDKIRALSFIENTLIQYRRQLSRKFVSPTEFPNLIDQLAVIIQALPARLPIDSLIEQQSYGVSLVLTEVCSDFPNIEKTNNLLYLKFISLYPSAILTTIPSYLHETFTDSLINLAAKRSPAEVYTYAQSAETPLGKAIQQNKYPLVATISRIANLPNALMYFPFLDDLYNGKKSISELQKIIRNGEDQFDSVAYFKLLVRTEQDYFKRMTSAAKDTAIAMFGINGLRESLMNRALRHFVTPINQLHDEADLNKRMRATDPLNAVELYYVMVLGESEIYTSSFKHTFHRMLARMGNKPRTDSLLLAVRFDYFKKFIKMCAGYNKLDTFLQYMPPQSANTLFKAFVSNLDKGNSLEDATDVADAYSSISDEGLKKKVLSYVQENEVNAQRQKNTKGELIYQLLKYIFLAGEKTNTVEFSKLTGISSIYDLNINEISDDSGRIIQQVFFYGDDDGKAYFPQFLNAFDAKQWKITKKQEWVEIQSIKDKIWVFANLPLNYDANLDDSAQQHLNKYLQSKGLKPTVVVHRGHSYWLPGTIDRMPESARIVLVGSCGGYKNLSRILEVAPEAHIISTKEIGTGDINRPILTELNQMILTKRKVDWRNLWDALTKKFNTDPNKIIRDTWENYVPPYHNLGAIFIKAYQKKAANL